MVRQETLPIYKHSLLHDIQINILLTIERCITTQTLSNLDFDLLRSPKVKPNVAVGFPIYHFLLVFRDRPHRIHIVVGASTCEAVV